MWVRETLEAPIIRRTAWIASICAIAGCGASEADRELSRLAQGLTMLSFRDGESPSPSYAGTRDATLYAESPGLNAGSNSSLYIIAGAQPRRVLFWWDVTAVPPGSIVRSVALELTSTDATGDSMSAHALRRAWAESAATWSSAGSTSWQVPGADGANDRGTAPLAAIGPAPGSAYSVSFSDAGVAEVQAWVDDPAANFGIVVIDMSGTDELVISSRENTVATRPRLSISYDPPDAGTDAGTDAGADAGASDSGSDGGEDGGVPVPDAGPGLRESLGVSCGCGTAPGGVLGMLAVAALARWRRERHGRSR